VKNLSGIFPSESTLGIGLFEACALDRGLELRFVLWCHDFEDRCEPVAGMGGRACGDLFGGASGYDLTAARAAFGAHVDDPVGRLDDVEVVLDNEE